jgi:predicted nucleic acid-binding protein
MQGSGGRRPATRGIFAIEDHEFLLPNPIALDTSFVVEALIATQPRHPACNAFLTQIVDRRLSVVTCELLRIELAEAAFAIALKERWAGQWRRHRTDGRARRRAARILADTLHSYDDMLGTVTHVSVRLERVVDTATTLMGEYGLASYDAVHAASAIGAGAEAIATTDTGFALLPSALLSIYTDGSRVASCRSKRRG